MRLWMLVVVLAVVFSSARCFSQVTAGGLYGSGADNIVRATYLGLIGAAVGAGLLGSGIGLQPGQPQHRYLARDLLGDGRRLPISLRITGSLPAG
jgi:hypothetical protein